MLSLWFHEFVLCLELMVDVDGLPSAMRLDEILLAIES